MKHTTAITGGCPICHTFAPTAVNLFHCTISRYQNIPIAYILNTFYHWLEIIMSNWFNLVFTLPSIVTEQNLAIHNYHFCQLNILKFRGFLRAITVTDSIFVHSSCCKISLSYLQCWPIPVAARSKVGSAVTRLLELRVRIPEGKWTFVCCEFCVLSGRGFCAWLITCPEESYRVWFV